MCRTERGGRAEAITTLIPRAGRPANAAAVRSVTCLESLSSVPSRSTATRRMSGSGAAIGTAWVTRGLSKGKSEKAKGLAGHDLAGGQKNQVYVGDRAAGDLLHGAAVELDLGAIERGAIGEKLG